MSSLKGGPELRAKLRAISLAFKPIGKAWADEAVKVGQPMVPYKTGKLRQSIRRTHATQRKATVGAWYTAYFIDKGTKAHDQPGGHIFQSAKYGRTIFVRKVHHPATRAQPFRQRMAEEALKRKPMALALIAEWNAARR